MKKRIINILLVIWIVGLTGLIGYNFITNYRINKSVEAAQAYKMIESIDINTTLTKDKQYKLSDILKSIETKNNMLVFFSPSCEPCNKEIAALEKLRKDNKLNMKIILIGVGEEIKFIDKYMEAKGLKYEYYVITWDEYDKNFSNDFVPFTLIVDKLGDVKFSKNGWSGDKDIKFIKDAVKKYR